MTGRLRYNISMNVQSRAQKIVLLVVLIVIVIAIIYMVMHGGTGKTGGTTLTPEQEEKILNTLEPSNSTANQPLTPAQQKALTTLGTGASSTPRQSSNTPKQEKSILDSLQ